MARLHRQVAFAAVVSGLILLVAAAAATVNAVWVFLQLLPESQFHDTYFVVSGAWIGLLIYAAGVVADIAFQGPAARLGRPAPAVWQSHLLFTTALVIVALAVGAGAFVDTDWQAALVLNAILILLLVAHGTALAVGGTLTLRARAS